MTLLLAVRRSVTSLYAPINGVRMSSKPMNTRTIRFNEEDLRDIEKFLDRNSFFDFSSLARVAIRRFIESPNIEIRSIKDRPEKTNKTEITL